MTNDVYVYNGYLTVITRGPGDITAIPPDSSLFTEEVWTTMATEAGGEPALIAELGAIDIRDVQYAS